MSKYSKNFLSNLKLRHISLLIFPLLAACQPELKIMPLKGTEVKKEDLQHCNDTVPYGFPQHGFKERKTFFLCHDKYTSEFNPYIIMPFWTAEKLNGNDLKENEEEKLRLARNKGGKDKGVRDNPTLPNVAGTPEMRFFEEAMESGFVPHKLVSMKNYLGSQREQSQTYYLTNYVPVNKNNVKIIEGIEDHFRDLIKKYNEGYIFSGPIYTGKPNNLLFIPYEDANSGLDVPNFAEGLRVEKLKDRKESGHGFLVPTHIFKMLYVPSLKRTMVYIVPNKKVNSYNINSYRQTLRTLEKITNINFFPTLSREKKEVLLKQ